MPDSPITDKPFVIPVSEGVPVTSTIPAKPIVPTKPLPTIKSVKAIKDLIGFTKEDVQESDKATEREQILKQMSDTLKEFDGESNIPINHDYWEWGNKLRSLKP